MHFPLWLHTLLTKLDDDNTTVHDISAVIEFPEYMLYDEEHIILNYVDLDKKIKIYCYVLYNTDIIHGPRMQYKNDTLFAIEFWRYGRLDVFRPSIIFDTYETTRNKSLSIQYNK